MPEENERTTHSWLQHIDSKIDALHERMTTPAPAAQVEALEKRTRHLEVKQAGVAATMTAIGLWLKSIFSGS